MKYSNIENLENIVDDKNIELEWNTYFDTLRLTINFLNENHREVLHLKYFSGLSYKEISALCNIPK